MNKVKQSSYVFEEEIDAVISKESVNTINFTFPNKKQINITKDKESTVYNKIINVIIDNRKTMNVSFNSKGKVLSVSIDKYSYEMFMIIVAMLNNEDIIINNEIGLNAKEIIDIFIHYLSFNDEEINKIIAHHIVPNISIDNAIDVINQFFKGNNMNVDAISNPHYSIIISSAIDIIALHLYDIINNKINFISVLPIKISEIIFEKYFENPKHLNDSSANINKVISSFTTLRHVNDDVYELLECEHKISKEKFRALISSGIRPSLSWKINSSDSYKESEAFFIIDNLISVILISYYDSNEDEYSVGIKINNDINTNSGNTILSILSVLEIPEITFKSKINFLCVFSNQKTKVLICKIPKFSTKFSSFNLLNCEFTLNIYTFISYNFSAILSHICKNFSLNNYHSLNSISLISNTVLNIILKNPELTVSNEDDIVIAVIKWINNRTLKTAIILEIIKNINWTSVSTSKIIEFTMTQNKNIIESDEIRGILTKALEDKISTSFLSRSESVSNLDSTIEIKRNYINTTNTSIIASTTSVVDDIVMNIAKVYEKTSASLSSLPSKEQYNTNYSNNSNSNIINTNPHYVHTSANIRSNATIAMNIIQRRKSNNIIEKEKTNTINSNNKPHTLSSQSPMIHSPKNANSTLYPNNNIRNVNVSSPRFNNPNSNSKSKYITNRTQAVTHSVNPSISPNNANNRNRYVHRGNKDEHSPITKEAKSKSLISERKTVVSNPLTSVNKGYSGYPNYVKNVNHFKSKSSNKNANVDSKFSVGKKKTPNFIEMAKKESKENKKTLSPTSHSNINQKKQITNALVSLIANKKNPRAKSVI